MRRLIRLLPAAALLAFGLSACGVVSGAASVAGTAVSLAGTAVETTVDVVTYPVR
ncbi:hypothetical protein [Azospirillum sp. SYSU D00513]|uniref:hypothetical protein n=1 Tax=Azospirillum sp. SYSU D00513 TaxID=2812561 RepID=UPI001A967F5C|nr:hypothetical protein [Azospirillum sp. SYSU D00513]